MVQDINVKQGAITSVSYIFFITVGVIIVLKYVSYFWVEVLEHISNNVLTNSSIRPYLTHSGMCIVGNTMQSVSPWHLSTDAHSEL